MRGGFCVELHVISMLACLGYAISYKSAMRTKIKRTDLECSVQPLVTDQGINSSLVEEAVRYPFYSNKDLRERHEYFNASVSTVSRRVRVNDLHSFRTFIVCIISHRTTSMGTSASRMEYIEAVVSHVILTACFVSTTLMADNECALLVTLVSRMGRLTRAWYLYDGGAIVVWGAVSLNLKSVLIVIER